MLVRCTVTIGLLVADVLPARTLGIEAGLVAAASSGVEETEGRALVGKPAGLRALQDGSPAAALGQLQRASQLCAQIAQGGQCGVAGYSKFCPDDCTAPGLAPNTRDEPLHDNTVCPEVVKRGQCSAFADLCPNACAWSDNVTHAPGYPAVPTPAGLQSVSCPVLLALPGGCANDLSSHDQAITAGTRVSDLCQTECSGHAGCAPSALDAGLLGLAEDSSGAGVELTLVGDACVDGGGVTFSGHGHVELDMGKEYARDASFSLAFWVLKAPTVVWASRQSTQRSLEAEIVYAHPVPALQGHSGIEVLLQRGAWLESWALTILLDDRGVMGRLNLLRDSIPKWTHISIVVDGANIVVWEDNQIMKVEIESGGRFVGVDLELE